jgi:hypothetical protein
MHRGHAPVTLNPSIEHWGERHRIVLVASWGVA